MKGSDVPEKRLSDVARKRTGLPVASIEDGPRFTLGEPHDPKVPQRLRRKLLREGELLGALAVLVVLMTVVTFGLAIAVVLVNPAAQSGVLIALVGAVFTLAGIVFPLYFRSSRSSRKKG
jgi:Flp pilus assembly protein TadB